jgi:V-type H+-transporting ATPase subunit G
LISFLTCSGKQRRLKQAKEEAQDEIERYRSDREKTFKEFEAKVS